MHFDCRKMVLDAFESGMFSFAPIKDTGPPLELAHVDKVSDSTRLKILILKEMLQRLPIALAQVKSDHTSDDLLNKIRKIGYSL